MLTRSGAAILVGLIATTGCDRPEKAERADRAPTADAASSAPAAETAGASPASSVAAAAPSTRAGEWSAGVVARGTEPFWSLRVDSDGGFTFERPGEEALLDTPYASPVVDAQGRVRFASGPITAVITPGECSDGMSDIVYPASAEVAASGATWRGCAYPRWDRALLALLPQIDACLAAAPEKGPVTLARREAQGVRVRVAPERDRTFECIVSAEGAPRIMRSGPPADANPLASERDPLFYRAPGVNPGGECFDAPEARSPSGELLGWLDGDQGC